MFYEIYSALQHEPQLPKLMPLANDLIVDMAMHSDLNEYHVCHSTMEQNECHLEIRIKLIRKYVVHLLKLPTLLMMISLSVTLLILFLPSKVGEIIVVLFALLFGTMVMQHVLNCYQPTLPYSTQFDSYLLFTLSYVSMVIMFAMISSSFGFVQLINFYFGVIIACNWTLVHIMLFFGLWYQRKCELKKLKVSPASNPKNKDQYDIILSSL